MPILPCLDHEALLHEGIAPHLAAYVRDRAGHLHEAVWIPKELRIDIDVASTMNENTPEAQRNSWRRCQRGSGSSQSVSRRCRG